MTPGHRVRVLLEQYDPNATEADAQAFAAIVQALLRDRFPEAVVVVYVEANPPPDEVG